MRRGATSARSAAASPSAHADAVSRRSAIHPKDHRSRPERRLVLALLVTLAVAGASTWTYWPFARSTRGPVVVAASRAPAPRPTPPPQSLPVNPRHRTDASWPQDDDPAGRCATRARLRWWGSAVSSPSRVAEGVHTAPEPTVVRRQTTRAEPAAATDDFQLGLYYQRAGEFEQALLHVRGGAAARRDERRGAQQPRACSIRARGSSDEAAREFRRVIAIDPKYVAPHINLGVTLLELGRFDAAAARGPRRPGLDPRNADAMVNLALAQTTAGQSRRRAASLLRAPRIDPHNAAAHYNLGAPVRGRRRRAGARSITTGSSCNMLDPSTPATPPTCARGLPRSQARRVA